MGALVRAFRRHAPSAFVVLITAASTSPAQTVERVNISDAGHQDREYQFQSAAISDDGRFVAFTTGGRLASGDTDVLSDVYIRDRLAATTTLASVNAAGAKANAASAMFEMTPDARFILFKSGASNLVAGDTNGLSDVFVRDRQTGQVTRENVGSDAAQQTFGDPFFAAISDDGRYVAFSIVTTSPLEAACHFREAFYVRDRATGQTIPIGGPAFGQPGACVSNIAPQTFAISGDGSILVFSSLRSDLVAGDTNGVHDVFIAAIPSGTITRLAATDGAQPNGASSAPIAVNRDGRFVSFRTSATNLIAGQTSPGGIYLHDRTGPTMTRVAGDSSVTDFSTDGRLLAFATDEDLAGPTPFGPDVYVYDRVAATTERVSTRASFNPFITPVDAVGLLDFSGDGRYVATASTRVLVADDTNDVADVYVWDRLGTTGPCAVTVSPSRIGATAAAGSASVTIGTIDPSCAWSARSNEPWLQIVGPASGVGGGPIALQFDAFAPVGTAATRTGAVTVNGQSIYVRQAGPATTAPFGFIDTPVNNATALNGSIAITGWALDDVDVARVRIFRDPVAPESPGTRVFIADATRVAGARPDVEQTSLVSWPFNVRAGWGYLLLSNMLPNQGNGAYTFHVEVTDVEGHTTMLGSRTVSIDNAHATRPFGTIDTPGQGAVVSGIVTNFGWALTPPPKTIPKDGSTIHVFIDGVDLGKLNYNHFRSDIAALFPGYTNSDGAVGFFTFDSRTYADGVHRIEWGVVDDAGSAQGIGSRFFTIANSGGGSALTFDASAPSAPPASSPPPPVSVSAPVASQRVATASPADTAAAPTGTTVPDAQPQAVAGDTGFIQSPAGWTASPSTASVAQPFTVTGYAVDPRATSGTGVTGVDIFYVDGSGPHFFGAATYGSNHPHLADTHGAQFANAGFLIDMTGLPISTAGGSLVIQAFGRSAMDGALLPAGETRVTTIAPQLTVAPAELHFGSATTIGRPAVITSTETLTIGGFGWTTPWTASANQSWIRLSATSGTGPGRLGVSIDPAFVPSSGILRGAVRVDVSGVGAPLDVPVRLDAFPTATTSAPFGVFEALQSPASGAVPLTGWALDDVEVTSVRIFRDATAAEGGSGTRFMGDATFVEGARPDVAAAFPQHPQNVRAGWGYLLLSNVLPGGGNGTVTFHAVARDAEGRETVIGSRTVTLNNATANLPFGTIDVPGSGATASGVLTISGWAAAPRPSRITRVQVVYDGQIIGTALYGLARPDVASALGGASGPVDAAASGFRFRIDTADFAKGLHTIAVVAFDSRGQVAGIGSRFFVVN